MKKCIFIIPYFGKFNNYFQLFLDSCKYNQSFDWLIFTDDKGKYDYPDNVSVIYTTFIEIKKKIEKIFSIEIVLNEPYKLCDYRLAYGEIFFEYIKNYEFWGFCDTDLIWGDISKFITNDILKKYDRILCRGHFTLLRNIPEINDLYKSQSNYLPIDYKFAFATRYSCHFDEFEFWNKVFDEKKFKTWSEIIFADIDCNNYLFYLIGRKGEKHIFQWNDGILKSFSFVNGVQQEYEWCYVHLQKRNMKVLISSRDKSFCIVPNAFVDCINDIGQMYVKYSDKSFFKKLYINRRIARMKEIVINIKNGALSYRLRKMKLKKNRR